MDNQTSNKSGRLQNFNTALFLGCCVVALSIFATGHVIASRLPHSLHGNLHGSFSGTLTDGAGSFREFMSEWEAADFLLMSHEEFERIIQSGELEGTYTTFQTERYVARVSEIDDDWPAGSIPTGPVPTPLPRVEHVAEVVDMRIFSRERLTHWLFERMDN